MTLREVYTINFNIQREQMKHRRCKEPNKILSIETIQKVKSTDIHINVT